MACTEILSIANSKWLQVCWHEIQQRAACLAKKGKKEKQKKERNEYHKVKQHNVNNNFLDFTATTNITVNFSLILVIKRNQFDMFQHAVS